MFYLFTLFLFMSSLLLPEASAEQAIFRPNIVNIVVDDLGYSDIGSYGGEILTPNIDGLAETGIRYSSYHTYPKCHPARDAMLTGMDAPPLRNPSDSITLAEALKAAGYLSYFVGKTHGKVMSDMKVVPRRGFDRSFGNESGGNYWTSSIKQSYLDGEEWNTDMPFYKTDVQTDFAIKFLDAHQKGRPFFLHLAYHAPHFPMQAKETDIAKYLGKYMAGPVSLREDRYQKLKSEGLIKAEWLLSAPVKGAKEGWSKLTLNEKRHYDSVMATYAAMIDNLDQNIGRVLSKLKAMGVAENTLIFFSSDNGGAAAGGRGIWPGHKGKRKGMLYDESAKVGSKESHWQIGPAWANLSNTPFRLFKNYCHEGGLSVPLIVNYSRLVDSPGSISHEQVAVFDIMPTALDAAGVEYPQELDGRKLKPMRGLSILPSLRGKALPENREFYFFYGQAKSYTKGKWKIVSKSGEGFDPEDFELFNIETDRTETRDRSKDKPEILNRMVSGAKNYVQREVHLN